MNAIGFCKSAYGACLFGMGCVLSWAQASDSDGPFPEKKQDPVALARAIESRQQATAQYLGERIMSAAETIKAHTQPDAPVIPPEIWRAAQGVWVFDQWQAGHLITNEVCVGLGIARSGPVWSQGVFYRAFDLGEAEGLASATRKPRRLVLLAMSPQARAWMELSRWSLEEVVGKGAKLLVGPRGALPEGIAPAVADIWVYDDSAKALEAVSPYPGKGTVLDNPWATQTAYGTQHFTEASAYLRASGAAMPALLLPLWEALQSAYPPAQ